MLPTHDVITARLHDPTESLSATPERTVAELGDRDVTVRGLMEMVGEQGLLIGRPGCPHACPTTPSGPGT